MNLHDLQGLTTPRSMSERAKYLQMGSAKLRSHLHDTWRFIAMAADLSEEAFPSRDKRREIVRALSREELLREVYAADAIKAWLVRRGETPTA